MRIKCINPTRCPDERRTIYARWREGRDHGGWPPVLAATLDAHGCTSRLSMRNVANLIAIDPEVRLAAKRAERGQLIGRVR